MAEPIRWQDRRPVRVFAVLFLMATLAVIVIPEFFRQREMSWIQQIEERLKNAAVAQQSYLFVNGEYADSTDQLSRNVYEPIPEVTITVAIASKKDFCIEARHVELPGEVWFIDDFNGRTLEGPCP